MPRIPALAAESLKRLQQEFDAAADSHGPLRCIVIHKEGNDFRAELRPPRSENVPGCHKRSFLYSHRGYCRNSAGKEVLCDRATVGTGVNPFLELKATRHEQFAARDIYLLRNRNEYPSSEWPKDLEKLRADPKWQELTQKTDESTEVFWPLAGDAGRCFSPDDFRSLPGVARESLEADDAQSRWLWVVFDLAWRKVKGSPLSAERWCWHETESHVEEHYYYETDFAREWALHLKEPITPEQARWIEQHRYFKDWAKQGPGFYYSSLDDLFRASVWAIDILSAPDAAPPLLEGRRMKRSETDKVSPWQPMKFSPATRQDCAKGFQGYADQLLEKLNNYAHRQGDRRELGPDYLLYWQVVGNWRRLTCEHLVDCPPMPELPPLRADDPYVGMGELMNYCRDAARRLLGKDDAAQPEKTPGSEQAAGLTDEDKRDRIKYLVALDYYRKATWQDRVTRARYRREFCRLTGLEYRPAKGRFSLNVLERWKGTPSGLKAMRKYADCPEVNLYLQDFKSRTCKPKTSDASDRPL